MKIPTPLRLSIVGLIALIIISSVTAVAATNTVPATRATDQSRSVGVNDLKPSACAALSLTNLITGTGTINGTNGNDLILGSSGVDTIEGRIGNDCILGGGGNDSINGGAGTDVCIGGPGTDTFNSCETRIQ